MVRVVRKVEDIGMLDDMGYVGGMGWVGWKTLKTLIENFFFDQLI